VTRPELAKAEKLAAQGLHVEALEEAARVTRQAVKDIDKSLNRRSKS